MENLEKSIFPIDVDVIIRVAVVCCAAGRNSSSFLGVQSGNFSPIAKAEVVPRLSL
jgi:hypothetical protein